MELYYLEDYSLGEISELLAVSRQAVYDNIKRTEAMLETYEEKLHLYDKFQQRMSLIEQLEDLIKEEDRSVLDKVNQLKELD
jgi:hypothetical protein